MWGALGRRGGAPSGCRLLPWSSGHACTTRATSHLLPTGARCLRGLPCGRGPGAGAGGGGRGRGPGAGVESAATISVNRIQSADLPVSSLSACC